MQSTSSFTVSNVLNNEQNVIIDTELLLTSSKYPTDRARFPLDVDAKSKRFIIEHGSCKLVFLETRNRETGVSLNCIMKGKPKRA